MANSQKLYQILEKASIETKIAVEIQDWIVDTIDERRDLAMNHFLETKLLPMHEEMRRGFDSLNQRFEKFQIDIDRRFEGIHSEMDLRFESIQTGIDLKLESFQSGIDLRLESYQSGIDLKFETFQTLVETKFHEIDKRFIRLEEKVDLRFDSLEKRMDATNFSIRILGVPIVGATIGGLGIIFLQIYERLNYF